MDVAVRKGGAHPLSEFPQQVLRAVVQDCMNRVEAQVLAGLEEGEQVVSGIALEGGEAAGARRTPRL